MNNKENGYTLVELIVALSIIAILAAIAIPNYLKVKTHVQAAEVSTNLHIIEDGIFAAIIDGKTVDDFTKGETSTANFDNSILAPYLSHSNFRDVPDGITLMVNPTKIAGEPDHFQVWVIVRGEKGTEGILDELEKMFPKTMSHIGNSEFIVIDSSKIAVLPKR